LPRFLNQQQATIVSRAQAPGSNPHAVKAGGGGATLHHLDSAKSRGAGSGASLRTQKLADKAKADPSLAREVWHGTVMLPSAAARAFLCLSWLRSQVGSVGAACASEP